MSIFQHADATPRFIHDQVAPPVPIPTSIAAEGAALLAQFAGLAAEFTGLQALDQSLTAQLPEILAGATHGLDAPLGHHMPVMIGAHHGMFAGGAV
jgi:hypothetical protein